MKKVGGHERLLRNVRLMESIKTGILSIRGCTSRSFIDHVDEVFEVLLIDLGEGSHIRAINVQDSAESAVFAAWNDDL